MEQIYSLYQNIFEQSCKSDLIRHDYCGEREREREGARDQLPLIVQNRSDKGIFLSFFLSLNIAAIGNFIRYGYSFVMSDSNQY